LNNYRKEQAIMTATLPPRKALYNLGRVDRIPVGEGRTFYVEDTPVAIFRTRDGKLFATQAFCSHKQGPLSDGIVGSDKVICPLHAYKFHLDTGAAIGHDCPALQTYSVLLNEQHEILLTL
jgi:nitrite reductase (NADH) small subunit